MKSKEVSRRELFKMSAAAAGTLALNSGAFGLGSIGETLQLQTRCEALEEPLGLQVAAPRLSWKPVRTLEGVEQTAYRVVASSAKSGSPDLWDSGKVSASDLAIEYAGAPLAADRSAHWRVETWYSDGSYANSAWGRWSAGPRDEAEWGTSLWIGQDDLLENTEERMPGVPGPAPDLPFLPAPFLRKEFKLSRKATSAMLYVAAVGYGEIHLNGQKLDATSERSPGFTNFDHRVEYVTYDVTERLQTGGNALGVILGTGWFDVHDVATWHFNTSPWRNRPRMRVMLRLRYADASTEVIISDASWQTSAGPILRDGIYTGEVYDARLEMLGWNMSKFDASAWKPALVVEAPRGKLVPVTCPPVRITETLIPVAIKELKSGVYLVDMGQNFSGHTQLRVKGPAGHAVTMRYAEVLTKDGALDTSNIAQFMMPTKTPQPFQQDTYLCKGSGELEIWEQRFSYAGFRYVEVTNFPGVPTVDNFRGRFAHADLKDAGQFTSSSATINTIQRATRWSYLSNAQSHPTDCPQREKNGWTGDAGLAIETGLTNFDSAAFYAKWLRDLADSQRPDGGIPVIVPTAGWGDGRGWPGPICPPWDAAYPIIAWKLYQYSGDKRVLREHAAPLRKYVEFFLSLRRKTGLVDGLGLGDWAPWKTETPLDYVSNAYLYLCLDLLGKIHSALGDAAMATRYVGLAREVASAMQHAFFDREKHQFANGSQTAQSLALTFGFVRKEDRAAVFQRFAADVERTGHIDTGILGAKFVLRALSEGGRSDLACHLVTQPNLPGWGYWAAQGATTLWEDWVGGSSYNHIMFGDVSAWFYEWIAGIQQTPESVAFERIRIAPHIVGDLTHATASYDSVRGMIRSSWTLEGKVLHLACEIPPGKPAELILPAGAHLTGRGKGDALSPGKHTLKIMLS